MSGRKLIIFAGPSGTGKTTIVRHLISVCRELSFSISATTRPRREGETDGRDYYFLSREEFSRKIREGAFVEYEEVYKGNFYGTLRAEIERIWDSGKHVIFDIDVVGALNLKKMYGKKALAVVVMPPSIEVLRDRLVKRGTETPETIVKRIGKAERELAFADQFDRRIVNDTLKDSLEEARDMVDAFINS
jgi:guanylate kinase